MMHGRHTGRVLDGLDEGLSRGGLSLALDLAVMVRDVEDSGRQNLVLLSLQRTSHSRLEDNFAIL